MKYCKTCRRTRDGHPTYAAPCHVCGGSLIEYSVEQLANLLFEQMNLLDEAKRISEDARRLKQELESRNKIHAAEMNTLRGELAGCKNSHAEEIKILKRRYQITERPRREIQG